MKMEAIEERAKQSATNIIDWCYDMDVQEQEQDPNFVTNEIVRAMKWERKECIDKACEWLIDNTENIEKRAREAFHAINKEEYQCALAEAQVYEDAFNHVKKEYEVAENAFVQGVVWMQNYLQENKVSVKI